jgi:hypothetical protein
VTTDEHWVVLWDPPVNKGTVARVFHDESKAWSFVRERLEPTGWPMNIRVIHASERLWQDEPAQAVPDERQYPETD